MEKTTLQQGLNEVARKRVHRMIDNNQPLFRQTMQRLMQEAGTANDYLASIGAANRTQAAPEVIFLEDGNKLIMNMAGRKYGLHRNAVGQLAEKVAVPAKYLRELSEGAAWQRKLAAEILNQHSSWTKRSRLLVRTVDDQVRGVLSDSYRRLNSVELVTAFLSAATAQGGVPCDALMTDTKIYVETIMPEPICIPTQRNGTVAIYMGARFSTSDYGDGAVEMRTFLLNGVCLNGMVRESVMKQIHLGARLSESQMLSDRTYRLDTATMVSAIGDYTRNLYDPNNLRQKSLEIQAASEAEVDFEAELKKLVKGGRLQKTEGEGVQKLLMANNPDDGLSGGATLWKLTQAITACARELAPARSRELQEISGELMARAL